MNNTQTKLLYALSMQKVIAFWFEEIQKELLLVLDWGECVEKEGFNHRQ